MHALRQTLTAGTGTGKIIKSEQLGERCRLAGVVYPRWTLKKLHGVYCFFMREPLVDAAQSFWRKRVTSASDARKRLTAKFIRQSNHADARAISRLFGGTRAEAGKVLTAAVKGAGSKQRAGCE